MSAFDMLILSFVLFLSPLALYCLVLAVLNRRPRPTVVSGSWDCIGLLLALSGFLLFAAPIFLSGMFAWVMMHFPASDRSITSLRFWALWIGYYMLVASGAALALSSRRHKTVIYNVEIELFGDRFARALATLGLDCIAQGSRLLIAPVEAFTTMPMPDAPVDSISVTPIAVQRALAPARTLNVAPGGSRYAEVTVERFMLLSHVTLHWENYGVQVRRDIEDRLAQTLDDAGAIDNPASFWFFSLSGLFIGCTTLLAGLLILVHWRR